MLVYVYSKLIKILITTKRKKHKNITVGMYKFTAISYKIYEYFKAQNDVLYKEKESLGQSLKIFMLP